MPGNYRCDQVAEETENAQAKIPADVYNHIAEQAASEYVSAAFYYRKWILAGYKAELKNWNKK